MPAHVTLQHPTTSRKRSFARHQLPTAASYMEAGWRIVDPAGYADLAVAMNVAETGSESDPIDPDTLRTVPAGTIPEVLAWVGGDPARAAVALQAEHEGSARPTLIAQLVPIAEQKNLAPGEGEKETEQ